MARDTEQPSQRGGTKQTNAGNFANDPDRAARAGQKGGKVSGGNFANDPQRASQAGRKGGQNSHRGSGAQ
ncbi:con-10 family general stress protein [Pseudomonas phoenicis]|uniref:general stress protein n=1 Tax=unclassified Pseudomonas TaxID=196821 RepID=UPI0039A03DDA